MISVDKWFLIFGTFKKNFSVTVNFRKGPLTALHTVLSIQCYPSPLSLCPAAAQGSDQIFLLNGHNLSSHLFENNSTLFRAQLLNLPALAAGDHL